MCLNIYNPFKCCLYVTYMNILQLPVVSSLWNQQYHDSYLLITLKLSDFFKIDSLI